MKNLTSYLKSNDIYIIFVTSNNNNRSGGQRYKFCNKIMKEYRFIYTDLEGNDLDEKKFDCHNDDQAMELGGALMGECTINDCWNIEVKHGYDLIGKIER